MSHSHCFAAIVGLLKCCNFKSISARVRPKLSISFSVCFISPRNSPSRKVNILHTLSTPSILRTLTNEPLLKGIGVGYLF